MEFWAITQTLSRASVVAITLICCEAVLATPITFQYTATWDQDFNGALTGEQVVGQYTFAPDLLVFNQPLLNVATYNSRNLSNALVADIVFTPIQVGADELAFLPGGRINVSDNTPSDGYSLSKGATLGGVTIEDGISLVITDSGGSMFSGTALPTDPAFFSLASSGSIRLAFDLSGVPDPTLTLTSLTLAPSLPGDLNGDGFVGIDDLNIVLAVWNQNVPPADSRADPSGDGFVGIDDLNTVLGNWNAGTPPANGAAIPEPVSLALLGAGAFMVLGRYKRHAPRPYRPCKPSGV